MSNYNPEVAEVPTVTPWPVHGGCGKSVLTTIQAKLAGLEKTKSSTGDIVEALQSIKPVVVVGLMTLLSAVADATVTPEYVEHWQVGGDTKVMTNIQEWVESGGGGSSVTAGNGLVVESGAIGIVQTPPGLSSCTIVGGVTINPTNYSASGFAAGKYIETIPSNFAHAANEATTFEMAFKFKYRRGNNEVQSIYSDGVSNGGQLYTSASQLGFKLFTSSYGSIITGTTTLSDGSVYWVKVTKNLTQYEMLISLDGEYYTSEGTVTTSLMFPERDGWHIGICSYSGDFVQPFNDVIYISDCYIKINGEYWWRPVGSGAQVAKATTSLYGLVKPDGTTISVTNGIIYANQLNGKTFNFNEATISDSVFANLTNVIRMLGGAISVTPAND